MTTSYRSLTVLSVAVFALLAYNFLGAAWTPAPATPPNNNTAAPVDVSGVTQTKTGNIVANIFAATNQMRSNLYCDALGRGCFSTTTIANLTPAAPQSLTCRNVTSALSANVTGGPGNITASCGPNEEVTGGGCVDSCAGVTTGNCSTKTVISSVPNANGWACTTGNRAQATARCCKVQ
ncbi:MAG: hypothetical protein RLZZ360_556 [Candidatus Parcubacteria bacterium]|jgi:hypothetical protein